MNINKLTALAIVIGGITQTGLGFNQDALTYVLKNKTLKPEAHKDCADKVTLPDRSVDTRIDTPAEIECQAKKNAARDLSEADLSGKILTPLRNTGEGLSGANFTKAKCIGTDFSKVNLRNANLSGANLTNAIFKNTVLTGADFSDATLTGAKNNGTAVTKEWLTSQGAIVNANTKF